MLADVRGGPEANDPIIPLQATLGRIEELIGIARDRPDLSGASWAIEDLTARWRWLRANQVSPPALLSRPVSCTVSSGRGRLPRSYTGTTKTPTFFSKVAR